MHPDVTNVEDRPALVDTNLLHRSKSAGAGHTYTGAPVAFTDTMHMQKVIGNASWRMHGHAAPPVHLTRGSFARVRASRSSTWTPPKANVATPTDLEKRAQQLQGLLQETLRLAVETGPRGFIRSMQAGAAVSSLVQEYLASGGRIDPPQVVLRKLFEKLGATYIKLGQFIASSPSLFPDEYVLEFQKCLDKTQPLPYAVIKGVLEQELKQPLDEVFSYIDPQPLASASVAQVGVLGGQPCSGMVCNGLQGPFTGRMLSG